MNLKTFCKGIQLDSGAQSILFNYHMDDKVYNSYKLHFYNDRFSFFDRVKVEKDYRKLFLYLFVRFAADAYEEYELRGIEDDIYFDTFSDIQIWCLNCLRDFGEYGIEQCNWLQEHIQLRLFKLGRLRFQPHPFDRNLEIGKRKIFKNQIILNVHIPQGEPLDNEKVEKSFEHAKRFFRGINPVFTCSSWLLYPGLKEILKPESNILQFQKHFFIYEVNNTARQAEERIFNKIKDDLSKYPEDTHLQTSAKAYLSSGNKLGIGYGIKFI